MSIEVRRAREDDIDTVVALAKAQELGGLDTANAEKSGFLVSGFSSDVYRGYLTVAQYFNVVIDEGRVVAFLLAYDSDEIKAGETLNSLLKYNLTDPFVLIKQICVDRQSTGKGYASLLYKRLFEEARYPRLAASVVIEPFNERSVGFHEKLGFFKLCDIVPPPDPDGVRRLRGVWFKDLEGNELPGQRWVPVNKELEQTLAMEKQHAAIGLYTHEDNLNWTKLGMLITFMFALLAAAEYLLKQTASTDYLILTVMLVLMGFSVNVMFYQKIQSGLMYMRHHKHSVNELDQYLYRLNPNLRRLVRDPSANISGNSVTTTWLRWLPLISLGIWTICSILLLLSQLQT